MNYTKMKPAPPTTQQGKNVSSLSSTRERCSKEISQWVEHVIRQVVIAGEEMIEEVKVLHNKMDEFEERGNMTSMKIGPILGDKVKFVPNVLFDELKKTDLGFLAVENFMPSDFHLDMVTMLVSVKVGGSITCMLSCEKDVSPTILGFLKLSVTQDTKPVTIKTGPNPLKFSFPLTSPDKYHVHAQLYGHHVPGSPLTVPVALSALPGLAQLGLAPLHHLGAGDDEGTEDVEKTKPGSNVVTPGYICVAKWSEDEVWYRARVDKVDNMLVEVTFLDYGNMEVVSRDSIVKCRTEVPAGENVDEFVVEVENEVQKADAFVDVSIGDLVVAKWGEDDAWYNAKIVSIGEERIEVTFVDYGNSDEVEIGKIVKTRAEVPEGDDIDENVLEIKSRTPSHESKFIEAKEPEKKANFSIGDVVVAKWEEDDVWYNAKVEEVTDEGYFVLFTDYGNSTLAKHNQVFKTASEIPTNETLDECVELRAKSEHILVAETSLVPAVVVPGWTRGSVCIARWTEDDVWYNAMVDSEVDLSGKYQVIFTDNGNPDTVTTDRIVASASNIPKDQLDMIDECVKITTTADVVQSPPTTTLIQDIKNEEAAVTATTTDLTDLKKTSSNCPRWAVGDSCIACWSEDGVWYNAVVESEMETSGKYQVIFTDYGNGDTVSLDRIVATAEDIPADQLEMIDECVKITTAADGLQSPPISAPKQVVENDKSPVKTSTKDSQELKKMPPSCKPRWAVGVSCIASWSEDGVWYNAVVEGVDTSGEVIVTFTDYGNSATVTSDYIVTTANDIPADQLEMVDECVQLTYNSPPQTAALLSSIKEEEHSPDSSSDTPEVSPKSITATRQSWKIGDFCVARWSEDGVWYNAEILDLSMTGYLVRFSDYGNEVTVKEEDVVSKGKDIPPEGEVDWLVNLEHTESVITKADAGQPEDNSQVPPTLACSLCRNVCRRGMRVACGPAVVCWGCAVKEINTSRSCWMCGEKEITTESHLVRDPVLRAFVDQFVNTGKLDPVHLQALKNGTLQPLISDASNNQAVVAPVDPVKSSPPTIKAEKTVSPSKNLQAGDVVIARWSEDDVWYNAVLEQISSDGSALVYFSDYGNSDQVKPAFIATNPGDLPPGAEVDPHVKVVGHKTEFTSSNKPSSSTKVASQSQFDFLSLVTPGPDGFQLLEAKQRLVIKDLKGPVGLTVLGDQTLAVVCKGDCTVRRFSKDGQFLGLVTGLREFVKPADILALRSGEFVVRDELGIQMFGEQGNFIKNLGVNFINRCYGLAEDELGRVITINCNSGVGGQGRLTEPGETDVFYIDTVSGAVIKRVELIDIVGEEKFKSACRFLTYAKEKLYVVDMGLDCVYVLFLKDGEEQADAFGSTGSQAGQFRDPAGLAVDGAGTMMVVDSKNNKLQLVNKDCTFCGLVKVDTPLSRPSGIFLDQQERELYVSDYTGQAVVCYRI